MMEDIEFIKVENVETLQKLNYDNYTGQIALDCRWFERYETYKLLALHLEKLNKKTHNVLTVVVKDNSMFHELESRCKNNPQIVQKLIIADQEMSNQDILESGKLLKSFYESEANYLKLFQMHPLLQLRLKAKLIQDRKRNNRRDSSHPTRRPTITQIKEFQSEAIGTQERIEHIEQTENQDKTIRSKKCGMCKTHFKKGNDIGKPFCKPCFDLNEEMLKAKAPLHNRYAIVTGGRIKIGLYTALRLLRDGCNVIVTTRFPNSARHSYSQLPDYNDWKNRVQFIKLDLLDMRSVQEFICWTEINIPHLDILINNAAQTIWRPSKYFDELQKEEDQLALSNTNKLKRKHHEGLLSKEYCKAFNKQKSILGASNNIDSPKNEIISAPSISSYRANEFFHNPANDNSVWFPHGVKADDGQQLDLRPMNSWRLKLTDIPFSELLQVLTINSVAPFVLISQLKPLLLASPFQRKLIVNVSAMEGQFSNFNKGPYHVHTNMAKAALNMLTRTSAIEFESENIFMTAVDTGVVYR
ncbi:uncharacterized protein [Clytia hemisphaerica]|uniref:uncharacterized protein n=1 Tax=Clytia hemisphaerica TaxID=252671 RepID=UPI0034D52DA4